MKCFRVQAGRNNYLARSILVILLLINLGACGFYLAGGSSLPPQLVSIQLVSDNLDSRQRALLSQQLTQAGADLKSEQAAGSVRLSVSIENLPERNLVDTARSGKAIIRLSRQLSYSMMTATGEQLEGQKTILRQMDVEFDSNDLAGLEYEKESARVLLDQALVGQLIFQLKHFQI
ncbi:MAG: LPS-assembly lipoprotein LptE [Planctomycetota bacterium]|jgi:outer membrane lipopolysaccharide assembly protein LptE/RlpB